MIDPSTHYKTARDIPPLSLTGNVKKVFFSQESSFRLYFAGASLLGTIRNKHLLNGRKVVKTMVVP
jgi:hypothetical protein